MRFRTFNILLIINFALLMLLSSCGKDDEDDNSLNNPTTGQTGSFTDNRDGKVYKWVEIGEQIWMAENLAYTGSDIQYISDYEEWRVNQDFDAYCFYENNDSFKNIYGVLYQGEAAKIACPKGWHLPTEEEWIELENYLIDNAYSFDGVIGNRGIAKSLASKQGWETSFNKGAVGNSDYSNVRNITGFYALPGGKCGRFWVHDEIFSGVKDRGFWWCASDSSISSAPYRRLSYGISDVYLGVFYKIMGLSVRCVKD